MGLHSAEAVAEQRRLRELLSQSRELLKQMQRCLNPGLVASTLLPPPPLPFTVTQKALGISGLSVAAQGRCQQSATSCSGSDQEQREIRRHRYNRSILSISISALESVSLC